MKKLYRFFVAIVTFSIIFASVFLTSLAQTERNEVQKIISSTTPAEPKSNSYEISPLHDDIFDT